MQERMPEWFKVKYNEEAVKEVSELMSKLKLNTVCKEANCPNLGECFQKHTATFMILGSAPETAVFVMLSMELRSPWMRMSLCTLQKP